MKSIYASKLFRSSRRQSKILAAMDNPINVELIKQLEEYLDDEYQKLERNLSKPDSEDDSSLDTDRADSNKKTTSKPNFSSNPTSSAPSSLSEKYGDDLDAESEELGAELDTSDLNSDADQSANSATSVLKSSIKSSMTLQNPLVVTQNLYSSLVGEIKGTLNARNTTCGVSRVNIKNNELWIYYNDDVNLNTVMPNTIDLLNASSYHYLVFNRLARTDNAIVFDITDTDTSSVLGDDSIEN